MSDRIAPGRAPGKFRNSDRTPLRIVGNLATQINNVYDSAIDGAISMKDTASSAVTGTIGYVGKKIKKGFTRSQHDESVAKEQEPDVSPQIEALYNELKKNYSIPKIELKGGQDGGMYTNILAYDSPDILKKLQTNKNLVKIFKYNDKEDVLVDNMKLNILKLNLLSLRTKDSGMSATFDKKIIFKGIDDEGKIFDFQNGATLYDNMEHHSSPEEWNYHLKKYNCAIAGCGDKSLYWSDIARGISEQKIAIYVKDSPEEEASGPTGGKRKTRRNKKMRSKKSRKNIKKRVNKKY